MKKMKIYGAFLFAGAMILLAGCGDGSEENGQAAPSGIETVEAEPLLSDTEREIINYEMKYSTGEFSAEDYQALAGLYKEAGYIKKQRDMLEQSYRLYQNTGAFDELQGIAVNLAEEDGEIAGEAELMLQNMELPEYFSEAIHMIDSEDWTDTMMPRLYEGKRNYFLARDGQTVLSVQAGYDENGAIFSNVWYYGNDSQITYLSRKGNTVQVLTASLSDGAYNGAFDLWTLENATGSIYHEQGTLSGGVFTGDYTMSAYTGTAEGSAFDLWNNREGMNYTVYTGSFDGEGKTSVEQPTAAKMEKLLKGSGSTKGIVYAYAQNGVDCLFLPLEESADTAAYSFGTAAAGVEAYPAFAVYEVKEDTDAENGNTGAADAAGSKDAGENGTETGTANGTENTGAEIKVRIFDGEVQLFDGKKWVSAGSVSSLAKDDPFRTYTQEKEAFLGEKKQNSGNSENSEGSGGGRIRTGTIQEETKAPAANKPAANKPAENKPVENKPAAPEAPAPETGTPAPSNPEPPSDPGPGNPEPPSTPEGGDTDIEWSPDLM